MIVEETCPKCGHTLESIMICTYPPIPQKRCSHCGWSWEGKREEIIRRPFIPPEFAEKPAEPKPAFEIKEEDNLTNFKNAKGAVVPSDYLYINKGFVDDTWISPKIETSSIGKLAVEFQEYFCIPCDLCKKYFKTKHDGCDSKIDKCNGIQHWRMLLERICENEES